MIINPNFVPGETNELSAPLINELVRFKLHEVAEVKEGVIRVVDQDGFWIEGGSLCDYLRSVSPGAIVHSKVQFVELKRIQWMDRR